MAARSRSKPWSWGTMDLTSRSLSARLRAGPPLARWLRRRREQWQRGGAAPRARPRWACLEAALGLAARQAARQLRFPVLLRGELSYPWGRTQMDYVPGAGGGLPPPDSPAAGGPPREDRPTL